ncbi:agamous-like MADS-box protein AGL62 [Gastrolobium bilobum]|uniref:agamous-like MADS-box protein AGL62 n=1 Tax=Gastrolobium bilobum TaxID=150636 RepID=UPI002AB25C6E|nr:agamous-like MADS-box protein AGL62 [Gastrolobium bilobum]
MSSSRRSKGRQKIEMKKMSNESNLQVTFSKRRSGLFKKASELCTLCGADVALVVFSPGEKVFSFGHPNVDAVIDRYLMRAPQQNSSTMQFIEAHRSANVRELNAQLTLISNQLDTERKRCEEVNRMRKATQAQFWWAFPIEDMNRAQLDQFKVALEELKKHITRHADRLIIQSATNPTQFFVGNSSSNPMHQPPPPPPQVFLPHMIQPPMLQNPMLQNHMFDGSMMRHHGFNNMGGGYGPAGFF